MAYNWIAKDYCVFFEQQTTKRPPQKTHLRQEKMWTAKDGYLVIKSLRLWGRLYLLENIYKKVSFAEEIKYMDLCIRSNTVRYFVRAFPRSQLFPLLLLRHTNSWSERRSFQQPMGGPCIKSVSQSYTAVDSDKQSPTHVTTPEKDKTGLNPAHKFLGLIFKVFLQTSQHIWQSTLISCDG